MDGIGNGGSEVKSATKLSLAILLLYASSVIAQDAALKHGKEVYAIQKCDLCHSISGTGGKMQALDGVGSRLKPDAVRRQIRTPREMKPNSTMKAYPNLPEKDLNDLVDYLMTLRQDK
jgi:mono/diheme cytochrome c family protein